MRIIIKNSATYAPKLLENPAQEKLLRYQVDKQTEAALALAEIYRNYQRQWGFKAGVNSGNGRTEAAFPQSLWPLIQEKYPDWATDDKVWAQICKDYPQFKAY